MRAVIAILLLAATVYADDVKPVPADHPATKRWDESKETYSKAMEAHKKTFLKFIQGVEDRTRMSGDTEKVKQIVAEKEAFEKKGAAPKLVKTASYDKDVEAAKTALRKEAKVATAAFLTAKIDKAAEIVDQELLLLLGEKPAEVAVTAPDVPLEWKADQGHRWLFTGEKRWIEIGPEGIKKDQSGKTIDRVWNELERTTSFIELKYSKGEGWIRLYSDHAEVHYGDKKYSNWGGGKWVTSPTGRNTPPAK